MNCQGLVDGNLCPNEPILGMSFCSEEHFDELKDERRRKAATLLAPRNGKYMSPGILLPQKVEKVIPQAPAPKQPEAKRRGRPWKVSVPREVVEADAHLSAGALVKKYGIDRSTAIRIRREQGTSEKLNSKSREQDVVVATDRVTEIPGMAGPYVEGVEPYFRGHSTRPNLPEADVVQSTPCATVPESLVSFARGRLGYTETPTVTVTDAQATEAVDADAFAQAMYALKKKRAKLTAELEVVDKAVDALTAVIGC